MSEQNFTRKRGRHELEDIIRALQADEVDAVVVLDNEGARLARLHRDEPLYRNIVDKLPQSVATVLPDGTLVYVNDELAASLGRNPEELLSRSLLDVLPRDERAGFLALLQRAQETPQEESFTFRWTTGDAPALVSASRLPILGAATIALVITDIREQVARRAAEEASRAKDEILASVSHELRVPLTAMMGWIQLLQIEAPKDDPIQGALREMKNAVATQTRLVDDLLDLARSERGALLLAIGEFDVRAPLLTALSFVRVQAQNKSIELRSELPPDPLVVRGDRDRLQQVFVNLLSNALKFTDNGHVHVRVWRDDGSARIEIADTGIGIAEDFLPQIFEPFRRGVRTTGYPGIGIGLAISRRLIEAHGGAISAASDGANCGATFTVTLPLA